MIASFPLAAASAARAYRRFEWTDLPQGAGALAALLAAGFLLGGLVYLYRWERRGRLWRWTACALRIAALAALGLVLLGPSVARETERLVPGRFVVLVDRSASMAVEDAEDPAGEPARVSRHEAARKLMEGDGGRLLRRLSGRNELEVLIFDEGVQRLRTFDRKPGSETAFQLPEWRSTGEETALAGALRSALESEPDEQPIAGVALLTDGRDTRGGDLQAAARDAAAREIPVHVVGIGSPAEPPNMSVAELSAPDRTFRDLPLRMETVLNSEGYSGAEVELRLTATDLSTGESREVLRRRVGLTGGRQTVDLTHTPRQGGAFRYEAAVEPRSGELLSEDNRAVAHVEVAEQQIRVLLAAGGPSREYRFLKALLARDPAFRVSTRLPSEGRLPEGGEALQASDVLVLLDPPPGQAPERWWRTIAQRVDEEGAGVVFVSGPAYAPELLTETAPQALMDLLPVVPEPMAGRRPAGGGDYFTRELPVEPDAEGAAHPVMSAPRDGEDRDYWADLPGLYWVHPAQETKAGATVLLRTAGERGESDLLAAVQPYGRGRVLWCGSPETWRWRRRGIARWERFWLQALRHCAGGRREGARGRATLRLARSSYAAGEAVRIRLRLPEGGPNVAAADGPVVVVARNGAEAARLRARRAPGEKSAYEAVFYPRRYGRFAVTYRRDGVEAREGFQVRPPVAEFRRVGLARDALERLAQTSGGRYFEPGEAGQLPEQVPDLARTVLESGPLHPAWDRAALLVLMVAALAGEWVLRKRLGMA